MYDLMIIGGGPAGYHAAEVAAASGLKTLLFEQRAVGGVCLNEGCIPSKALLHSAKLFDYANGGSKKYGVSCDNPKWDYNATVERKDKVVKTLVRGIENGLQKAGVEIIREHAVLEKRLDGGFEAKANGTAYQSRYVLVCAGSEPVLPPIQGLNDALSSGFAMTNREILSLTQPPERLVVVGGGVIGLEMASLMNSAGTKVTVIELLPKIAGNTDDDIAAVLQKEYEKKGVTFLLNAALTSVGKSTVTYRQNENETTLRCDKVLLSIGRRAASKELGLENLGILTERGAVVTDERMKTNVPGVYAAGDINGRSMLAHTAYREAEVAVNTILGKNDTMRYDAVPAVIYTNPEAASAGETLQTAKAKGLNAREVKLPMAYSGRFLAENEDTPGLCKLVWEETRLIGVHMLGGPCSEIISSASALISLHVGLEQCKRLIFPHPSVAEILHEGFYHS